MVQTPLKDAIASNSVPLLSAKDDSGREMSLEACSSSVLVDPEVSRPPPCIRVELEGALAGGSECNAVGNYCPTTTPHLKRIFPVLCVSAMLFSQRRHGRSPLLWPHRCLPLRTGHSSERSSSISLHSSVERGRCLYA